MHLGTNLTRIASTAAAFGLELLGLSAEVLGRLPPGTKVLLLLPISFSNCFPLLPLKSFADSSLS